LFDPLAPSEVLILGPITVSNPGVVGNEIIREFAVDQ
jgi:hypothetical protein